MTHLLILLKKSRNENMTSQLSPENVDIRHLKQSFSGLHSPGRSQFTEL